MAEKRMTCLRCPRYDRTARRCRDGKANPKKKADSITVAEVLGVQTLCHYNPFRDALAIRMYHPQWPTLALAKARRWREIAAQLEHDALPSSEPGENGRRNENETATKE